MMETSRPTSSGARLPAAVAWPRATLPALIAVFCLAPAAAGAALASTPTAADMSPRSAATESGAPKIGPSATSRHERARFQGQPASRAARQVADWVVASDDNRGLPFVVVDKVNAEVFVFDDEGLLRGAASALLGRARGDDSVAGIGSRRLATIRPEERTTPAGRFVASLGHDFEQDILWVDFDAALSLHRVIKGDPNDHRLQRLASPSPLDRRISYGCINVPVTFYEQVVVPAFTNSNGIVYILPEVKSIRDVFTSYSVPSD